MERGFAQEAVDGDKEIPSTLSEQFIVQQVVDPAEAIPSLLEPANTSSPRDTLLSFLRNINDGIRRWRDFLLGRGRSIQEKSRTFENALRCLDLSEVPEATRSEIGLEKAFLLKEILDPVEIPVWDAIPGKDEVAEKKIARWTLPGTEITIAQMEEGQRAGEFLVSAYTVQQLKNFYELGSSSWGRPD